MKNRLLKLCLVIAVLLLALFVRLSLGPVEKPMGGIAVSLPEKVREQVIAHESVHILAFGDLMLDRQVRNIVVEHGGKYDYPFEHIKDFLKGNDIVVANAEGVFTDYPSVTADLQNKVLRFTFDKKALPVLKTLGFTVLSQTNNHMLDFGHEGYEQSITAIEKEGMTWFGEPKNTNPSPRIITVKDRKIAFVGYHQFFSSDIGSTVKAIREARASDVFIIVYPHWGEEYNPGFTSFQSEAGHAFIDAGADVVIGGHPHVIEPIEIYKNKPIFYSIGNFIFDQDFSKATRQGLALKIVLGESEDQYFLEPFAIKSAQAILLQEKERDDVLSYIANVSDLPQTMRESIKERGLFTLKTNK